MAGNNPELVNLAEARAAAIKVAAALAFLQTWFGEDPGPSSADNAQLSIAAAVEASRALQRAAEDMSYWLSAEALDRGVRPRTMDWNDGAS